ncbi:MAG: glycerol kinase [Marinilabiliales bacterium]|nr:MAG: glycerol kinase [Marinilabiliales bacterium]
MIKKYILALDQGTTSSRAVLFDNEFNVLGIEQSETTQIFPKPGWVEQDATEIRETQIFVARKLISRLGVDSKQINGIGITNQRETTILWDKKTGQPVYNAIVWQDKRTSDLCEQINKDDFSEYIRKSTGLVIDSYFSGTKVLWLLDNIKGLREKAEKGQILFGTVDTWLIWNLSGGRLHITDYSNASRTLLYSIHDKCWDKEILDYFNIPLQMMPEVVESSGTYGKTEKGIFGNSEVMLSGIAGDKQAALFGQTCFDEGDAKNTYGTGCFMLMNTGDKPFKSKSGLLTTIAWGLNGKITYALEGSVFIAGAAIQWLRDKLRLIESASDTEKIAFEVTDSAGVYFVPAFSGLGAPFWNMNAIGIITGLTAGVDYRHIVRAALESMAFQTRDVLNAMQKDSGIEIGNLNVDGGASANNFLLQFQADILGVDVSRPEFVESTALGAGFLAAIGSGVCEIEDLKKFRKTDKVFHSNMSDSDRQGLCLGWTNAIDKARK